jgi:hypothetical protein
MMKNIDSKSYSAHQELSQLLPWFVNKTLQGAELKAVESHLSVCLTCKREVAQLQKLAQAVIQEGALDSAEHASFSRLKKRLHSGQALDLQALPQQVRPEQAQISASTNVSQLSRSKKQVWTNTRPALAMAAAVLLSLSVLMPRHVENDMHGSDFRTLSSDAQPEVMNANEVRVVFAENVDEQQKNTILERVHGQFTSNNPTAQGVYTVRLDRDIAKKHLLDVVELLRKDTKVIFAEPAYALLSTTHTEK